MSGRPVLSAYAALVMLGFGWAWGIFDMFIAAFVLAVDALYEAGMVETA